MKLSELIESLQDVVKSYGDIQVKVFSAGTAWTSKPHVEVIESTYSNDQPFVVIAEPPCN